jgi:hypothetical protein
MKHLKIILPLLLCGLWSFSQTVTPNPGPYTPMSQKYQYPWLKTTGGIWNPGKLIVGDSAQFSGVTYVIDPPDGDSSTLMANTAWVLRNSGTGGGGSNDTVITKFPLYTITGGAHDSIAVYGVDSSIQLVTAVNDSLLRFTRFNGTTFDVPVIGGAGGGGGGSGTVTNVATGYGLSGGPITTTGTLLVDTASSIASKTYVDNKDALKANQTALVDTAAAIRNAINSSQLYLASNYIKALNDSTIYFDSTLVLVKANNLSDLANAGTARTNLGATTIGGNIFTLTNPSALGYIRANADNTVTHRSYANVKVDLSLDNVDNTSDATKNSATATLTNKRWTARVGSTTSSATPTINTDSYDIYKLTAQTADITSFTTNLTGTPVDGDIFEIQITGTAARAITWGSSFVSSTVTLPTTTVTTATLTVILQYYTTSSYGNNKWVCANYY